MPNNSERPSVPEQQGNRVGTVPRRRISPAGVGLVIASGVGLPCAVALAAFAGVDALSFARTFVLCMAAFAMTGLTLGVVRRIPVIVGAAVGLAAMAIAGCFGPPFSVFLPLWMMLFGAVGLVCGIVAGALFCVAARRLSSPSNRFRLERGKTDVVAISLVVPAVCLGGWFLCEVAWSLWSHRQAANERSIERGRVLAAFGKLGPYGMSTGSVELINGTTYDRIELSLRNRGVVDAKMRVLEGLQCPHIILELDLSENKITDAGLESISHLKTIKELRLAETEITDRGIAHLTGLENLARLDLTGTRVTNDCGKHLERLPRLKTVYASGTGLTNVKGVEVRSSRDTP